MSEGQIFSWVVFILVIWWIYSKRQWHDIFPLQSMQQHLVFGSAVALLPIWMLKASITPYLELHFLGLTAVTLLLGWRFALLSGMLTLAMLTVLQPSVYTLVEFSYQALVSVITPIMLSYFFFLLTYSYLPRHLFIYIFIAAFFNAALTMLGKLVIQSISGVMRGFFSWDLIVDQYLHIWPLLLFPEALLNGMIITLLAVYRPHWLYTYKEKDYLSL